MHSLDTSTTGKKTEEAAENRNYLASRMTDEINEIIRVLQLTTYDEDEWDADNLTCMKKAQVSVCVRALGLHARVGRRTRRLSPTRRRL